MIKLGNLLLFNGKITTLDPKQPEVSAILISNDVVAAIGLRLATL